eukprot:1571535-Amphidinium_carterae.1
MIYHCTREARGIDAKRVTARPSHYPAISGCQLHCMSSAREAHRPTEDIKLIHSHSHIQPQVQPEWEVILDLH